MKRLVLATLGLLGLFLSSTEPARVSARQAPTFDTSECRENTYGPPDHYVDPERLLTSSGAGTEGDPWNTNQAMANATAGDVVCWLPGVSVLLPSANGDNIPTLTPANSGTSGNRIVHVAQFAAIALSDIENNASRTQLRHDGVAEEAATAPGPPATGSPMYGAYFVNYITWDGFHVKMAEAQPRSDSGVIRCEFATGTHFLNFVITGTTTNMHSNPVIYRPLSCVDTVLRNFRSYGFSNPTINGATQPGLFSDQYGDRNVLIEHFEIHDSDNGIFFKGSGGSGELNYGTVRYGIVRNTDSHEGAVRLHAVDNSIVTEVHHILVYDYGGGIVLSGETQPAQNMNIHHITLARGNTTVPSFCGCFCGGNSANAIGTTATNNVTIQDNICDYNGGGSSGQAVAFGSQTQVPQVLDYNWYRRASGTLEWSSNGNDYTSIASWRAAIGSPRDTHSTGPGSDPFTNRAGGDFTIASAHAALTASSTGGELGAFEGSIDPGPYVNAASGGGGSGSRGKGRMRMRGK